MPAVSNTSPLLNLAIIHQHHLLQHQFEEILIPPAVLNELRLDTAFPGVEDLRAMFGAGWLRVVELNADRLALALTLQLDEGEAAAIALAVELGIGTILLDERDGRAQAKAMGLEPIGVLGILLKAKRDGQLASVSVALEALRTEAGFFVSDELATAVLAEAGETA